MAPFPKGKSSRIPPEGPNYRSLGAAAGWQSHGTAWSRERANSIHDMVILWPSHGVAYGHRTP